MKIAFTLLCIAVGFGGAVSAVGCPDGWVSFHDSCYLFPHGMASNFVTAENYCRQHNGHLVHVDSAEENRFLKNVLSHETPAEHWMGLTDENIEGTWLWYDTGKTPTFTGWLPKQPDNLLNQDCAAFDPNWGYGWDDVPCTNFHAEPICEISSGEAVIVG